MWVQKQVTLEKILLKQIFSKNNQFTKELTAFDPVATFWSLKKLSIFSTKTAYDWDHEGFLKNKFMQNKFSFAASEIQEIFRLLLYNHFWKRIQNIKIWNNLDYNN